MTFVDILQPISTTRYEKHVDRGRDAHLGQFEFSLTERIASDKSSPKLFFFSSMF